VQVPYVWKPSHEKWMHHEQGLRLVIWGFFDESGKLLNADDYICLSGYLADENWDGFTSEWGLLLKQHNLPSIHMARLLSRNPPFEKIKWSEGEQGEILRQFVNVIRKHTAAFCSVSLDAKHYRSLPREAREQFGQKTALDFSFQRLLRLVIQQLQSWQIEHPISLNFDYEEQSSLICIRSLAKLRARREEIKKLIGAITFCDSSVYYPLQAADMLAYGTYQHLHGNTLDYMGPLALKPSDPGPIPSSEHYPAQELDSIWNKFKKGEIERL
jgi:hypothetical protein